MSGTNSGNQNSTRARSITTALLSRNYSGKHINTMNNSQYSIAFSPETNGNGTYHGSYINVTRKTKTGKMHRESVWKGPANNMTMTLQPIILILMRRPE